MRNAKNLKGGLQDVADDLGVRVYLLYKYLLSPTYHSIP